VIKAVRKFLFFPDFFCKYLRNRYDILPLVAVAAVGRNEQHTVFRRCTAPEKIRIVRTGGSNSGELKVGKSQKKSQNAKEKAKKRTKSGKIEKKVKKRCKKTYKFSHPIQKPFLMLK